MRQHLIMLAALFASLTACPTQPTDVPDEDPNQAQDEVPSSPAPANANDKLPAGHAQQPNVVHMRQDPNHAPPLPKGQTTRDILGLHPDERPPAGAAAPFNGNVKVRRLP